MAKRRLAAVVVIMLLALTMFTLPVKAGTRNEDAKDTLKTLVERELGNARAMKAKVSVLLKRPIAGNAQIKRLLRTAAVRLDAIEAKLAEAEDVSQMEAALDTASEDASSDTAAYVQKLTELMKTLNEIYAISATMNVLRMTLKKAPIRIDYRALDRAVTAVLSKTKVIRVLYSSGRLVEMMREVEAMRKVVLAELAVFTKANSRHLGYYPFARFFVQIEKMRKKVQFGLPYLPQDVLDQIAATPPAVTEERLNILVCMMRWNNDDPVLTEEALFEIMDEADAYYYENSYGRVRIGFDFAGTGAVYGGAVPDTYTAEAVAAANTCGGIEGVNLGDYDRVIVYPSLTRTNGGVALTGLNSLTTERGETVGAGFILLAERDIESELQRQLLRGVAIHEIGHFFGGNQRVRHANFYDCGGKAYDISGCTIEEYGNPFDVMGRSGISGHFGGWFKVIVGWIDMLEVSENEQTEYALFPLETASRGAQVIRIPYAEHPLCVEYRTAEGYDDFMARSEVFSQNGSNWGPYMEAMAVPQKGCLLVNICDYDPSRAPALRPQTALIDTTPGSIDSQSGQWDRTDACIEEGREFTDDEMGLVISFTARAADGGKTYAGVRVSVDEVREFEE